MADDELTFASGANDQLTERGMSNQFGSYTMAQYDGTNRCGWQPLCDKVLVLADQPAPSLNWTDADGKAIEFVLTDKTQEDAGFAAITGVLVAVGPQAFAYDSHRVVHWEGKRPQPGDRVTFRKYAGQMYTGRDGLGYRIMEDRLIDAVEVSEDATR